MIIGIGIDLVDVARIEALLVRHGERFMARVLTGHEREVCGPGPQQARRVAARFAAKEAALKALGTGLSRGLRWQDIEVRRDDRDRPTLRLYARAAERAQALGITALHVSLSHDGPLAAAFVIAEGGDTCAGGVEA